MFGPAYFTTIQETLDFCHREPKFFDLMTTSAKLFQDRFNLHDFDILFLSGSGTLAMESLIFSSKNKVQVLGPMGKFSERWTALSTRYNHEKESNDTIRLSCAFETSRSEKCCEETEIIDAVSSFPYYEIPASAIAFGTVSSKQLGAAPVLGIVGIRKNAWNLFINDPLPSCLNLSLYRSYALEAQTPFTPAYTLLADLKRKLESFDVERLRKKVETVSNMLVTHFGEEHIIGDKIAPAISISAKRIPEEIARKWNLYGCWKNSAVLQIFTYSEEISAYQRLIENCNKI